MKLEDAPGYIKEFDDTETENNNPRASTIVAPVFALPKMFAEWPFPLIGRTSFSDQAFS